MRLFELISTEIYPYKEIKNAPMKGGDKTYTFDADGIIIQVDIDKFMNFEYDGNIEDDDDDDLWVIEFYRKSSEHDPLNYSRKMREKPKHPFKVFGTIQAIANAFLNAHKPDRLLWFADNKKKRSIYRWFKHPDYVHYKDYSRRMNGDHEEGLARK